MLRLRFEQVLTADGFTPAEVAVHDNGHIAAVKAVSTGPWDGWLALPGMVNAHSHSFQRAMCGLTERAVGERTFWGWRELMYRIAARVTPQEQYAIAAQAFREMLAGGYTSVGEFHYLHHLPGGEPGMQTAAAVGAAARDTGIRLSLLPVYYARGGFDAAPLPEQARFVHASIDAFVEYASGLGADVAGVAPHSLRAVDVTELPVLAQAARAALGDDAVIHIHIAEQRREVGDCQAATGFSPVSLLARECGLDERWSLVHATHANAAELEQIITCDANVVLCPLTEANLGDGLFPAAEFVRAGGTFAIGSDCNARIDAAEELRLLEYGQRLVLESRACLATADGLGAGLWASAARAGARALNNGAGAIEPGRWADLVVLDRSAPLAGLQPLQALDALVTGGSGANIACVYVGGQPVVTDTAPSPDFVQAVQRLAQ